MRIALALLTLICLAALPAEAKTYVYCIENRIVVEQRDMGLMRRDRGYATICTLGPSFDFTPDATRWVEANLRQRVGGDCRCP